MRLREIFRAAGVIARRDFVATVFSKVFIFFLLGPFFPLLIAGIFAGIGASVVQEPPTPRVLVAMDASDVDRLNEARDRLAPLIGDRALVRLAATSPTRDPVSTLAAEREPAAGVLSGTIARPVFTGASSAQGRTTQQVDAILTQARLVANGGAAEPLKIAAIVRSTETLAYDRQNTARAGQAILFFLTLLLAGMLLSQLIDEKASKVIEILAAAVPVDAIFLGKLFAMLCMSLLGIAVWTGAGALAISTLAANGLSSLTAPAIGWPLYLLLGIVYFSMSYLLLGAAFLGIGAQATTAREVQTMSMPVTMMQVVLFAFSSAAVGQSDKTIGWATALFPFSSPFAMFARAAESPLLWPHLLALAWQTLWVAIILKLASAMFRKSVLKSGPSFRWPWQRKVRV